MTAETTPPTSQRLPALDLMRGLAVLGILLANLAFFAGPFLAAMDPLPPDTTFVDRVVAALSTALVNGKFRGMLAILFGAGLYLQYSGLDAAGKWPGAYVRRMLWLAAIGAFHGIFIWLGDVLLLYALSGLVCIPFVKLSGRVVAAIGGTLAFGLLAVSALLAVLSNSAQADALTMGELPLIGNLLTAEGEAAIYQSGTFLQQLGHRSLLWLLQATSLLFYLPLVLPLFMAGMLMARRGVFDLSKPDDGWRRRLMLWGLGLGLPLNALAAAGLFLPVPFDARLLVEGGLSMVLALGYVGLGLWLTERVRDGILSETFRRVGRTALSCYLLQSLLATTIFYSWGLGWYGQVTGARLMLFALPIWAIVIAFAWFWTSRYDIGPVEWAWRSLVAKRKLPWRNASAAPPVVLAD